MDIFSNLSNAFSNLISEQPHIIYLWIFILSIFFLIQLLRIYFKNKSANFKYESLGRLFSDAEHFFYLTLRQALNNEYQVFAKVRIADILTPDRTLSNKNWNSAFFRITSKHFDYVLCDKKTLSIVAVIELDDKSHQLSKIRARDIFIQKACESAGLKLLRFPCKSHYDIRDIREKIMNSLN